VFELLDEMNRGVDPDTIDYIEMCDVNLHTLLLYIEKELL